MKILIDARFLNLENAGLGRMSFELIRGLNAISPPTGGNEYVLLAPKERPDLSFLNKNFKIIETKIKHYSFAEQIKLPKIIRAEKPDLVHFLHFNHPIFLGAKFIVNILDLTLSDFPALHNSLLKKIAYQAVISRAVKKAKKIITISETVKKQLVEKYKIAPAKIEVVYLGYDSKFRPRKSSCSLLSANCYLLYVGQIRPHKNLHRLVEAFKILEKDYPKLKLIIAGRGKIKLAKPKNLIFAGSVSDKKLVELYQNAAVFVLPSLSEGFGLPLIEAMACATPVACSDIDVLREIGADAPLYFDPYDPQDIAYKIGKILDNGKLRKTMGDKGLEQAKKFSWQTCAEQILEIYSNL